MTNQLLTAKKTHVKATKFVSLADLVPDELRNEYYERQKALGVTEAAMSAVIKESSEFQKLGPNTTISYVTKNGGAGVDLKYSLSIDGRYEMKTAQIKQPMDYTTFNLLLNNKILTNDEKRALLKERGLLPIVVEAEETPEE